MRNNLYELDGFGTSDFRLMTSDWMQSIPTNPPFSFPTKFVTYRNMTEKKEKLLAELEKEILTDRADPAPEQERTGKKAAKKPEVIIQSPMGGIITPEEILKRVGKVDKVYVRVDQNKAHWVRGDEVGSIDLWD